MKFNGKVSYPIILIIFLMWISFIISSKDIVVIVFGMMFMLSLLYSVLHNYTIVDEDKITIYFGFKKTVIAIDQIVSIDNANPFQKNGSRNAFSFEKIKIEYGNLNNYVFSVKDKKMFLEKIKELNPNIKMNI